MLHKPLKNLFVGLYVLVTKLNLSVAHFETVVDAFDGGSNEAWPYFLHYLQPVRSAHIVRLRQISRLNLVELGDGLMSVMFH